jgi:hypothetical protein
MSAKNDINHYAQTDCDSPGGDVVAYVFVQDFLQPTYIDLRPAGRTM